MKKNTETLLDIDLDESKVKIKQLEMQVASLMDNLQEVTESLKETQKYLVMLAHNQKELTKRVSQWPYIVVNNHEEE